MDPIPGTCYHGWFKKQCQKCITHGSGKKIDVYQAVLKYLAISLVDINFFAYTFLKMFFKPEYSVHGIGCNF